MMVEFSILFIINDIEHSYILDYLCTLFEEMHIYIFNLFYI